MGQEERLNQNSTPLIDAICAFERRGVSYFNVPSHRAERGEGERIRGLLGDRVFAADLTETDGTDDLHAASGPILEAERLAADLFGSEECRFLVNGTSCGNVAMILAAVRENEKILVARNAHRSVWTGLQIAGALPVWLTPCYDPLFHVFAEVNPESVERALASDPEIRAVFLTNPTYYGVSSDLTAIAEICHRHDCVLLVDEAHGTHFYFDRRFPRGAVTSGADLAAMSMHKTGGSLTQSSLLHRCGNRIDPGRLGDCLRMVQSSSPSYLLMASLDGARHDLAENGPEKMERAFRLAEAAREGLLRIPGVRVLGGSHFRTDSGACQDPLRVVFSAEDSGLTGYAVQEALFRKICLIGTYIKRRCNLRLTELETSTLPSADLELSLSDMVSCIALTGVRAELRWEEGAGYSPEFSLFIFDTVECLLESHNFAMESIGLASGTDGCFTISVTGEGFTAILPEKAAGWFTSCINLPNGYVLTLGERKVSDV